MKLFFSLKFCDHKHFSSTYYSKNPSFTFTLDTIVPASCFTRKVFLLKDFQTSFCFEYCLNIFLLVCLKFCHINMKYYQITSPYSTALVFVTVDF